MRHFRPRIEIFFKLSTIKDTGYIIYSKNELNMAVVVQFFILCNLTHSIK